MTIKVELAKAGFDGQVEHLVKLQSVIAERLRTELLVKPRWSSFRRARCRSVKAKPNA